MRAAPLFTALAFLAVLALGELLACSSGGGGAPAVAPGRVAIALPPFTLYSTDLSDLTEGTVGNPLRVAAPPCKFLPELAWQAGICDHSPAATVWSASNAVATTRDWNRWRFVVNVEEAWDTRCNTGPPNQSYLLGSFPIIFDPQADHVTYGFEISNEAALCSKIPYVAATYIRGVQGDPVAAISPWGKTPVLTFTTSTSRTMGPTFAQSVYVWAHFKASEGIRYMPQATLWNTGYMPRDFTLNWNWPAIDSYYYPGAWMHGGDFDTCGSAVTATPAGAGSSTTWTIDVELFALCRFPELANVRPDFQGFELATEGTYLDFTHPTGLPNRMTVTLSGVRLDIKP